MRGIVRVTGPDCLSAIRLAFADVQLGDQPQQIPATISFGGQVEHRLEGQLLAFPKARFRRPEPVVVRIAILAGKQFLGHLDHARQLKDY